ncbi:MAG: STAS domain-containing protein [Thermodesulfobacteriota bacterium]
MFEVIIRPSGDLVDFRGWDEFAETLTRVVETGRNKVVLDLGAVNRMSSNYISSVIDSYNLAQERGREMVLINVSDKLYDLLDIFKLTTTMKIHRT